MKSSFSYHIDGKEFVTRYDFIEYCESKENPRHLFNTGEFRYHALPETIDIKQKIDAVNATKEWIDDLRERHGKPIVLLFGGGLDSTVVLDFMIRANRPPDYLLTITSNPFDNKDFLSPLDMEARYSLRYSKEIIENNSVLKGKTKLWHLHQDKAFAEEWFESGKWLRALSMMQSLESVNRWKDIPPLSEQEKKQYTFVKGGNFPKVRTVDGETQFYLVDVQLGSVLDLPEKKTHDFILDNPQMLAYMACEYNKAIVSRRAKEVGSRSLQEMYDCHYDHTDKRYIEDFNKFIATQPPQLDKRFDSLVPYMEDVKVDPNVPYYVYLHRTPIKSWFNFLMAEWLQPSWYQTYKRIFKEHEEWIKRIHTYPGKLTKPIRLVE